MRSITHATGSWSQQLSGATNGDAMRDQYLEAVRQPDQIVNPLFNLLGVVVEQIDADAAVLRLPPNPGCVQGAGIIAGGVLATLADEAMAHVVIAGLEPGQRTATIDFSMRCLSPARPGVELLARATVLKRGSRVIFAQAEVTDAASGQLLAVGSASFAAL